MPYGAIGVRYDRQGDRLGLTAMSRRAVVSLTIIVLDLPRQQYHVSRKTPACPDHSRDLSECEPAIPVGPNVSALRCS